MPSSRCPDCGRSCAGREGSTGSHWSGCSPRRDDWSLFVVVVVDDDDDDDDDDDRVIGRDGWMDGSKG